MLFEAVKASDIAEAYYELLLKLSQLLENE